jgi:hypothetical protein
MKTEIWYEVENESTGEVTKYASFDDLRTQFTKIDYGSYGSGLESLDHYKITAYRSTKKWFKSKTETIENRYAQKSFCFYVKISDAKARTDGWIRVSPLEEKLLNGISQKTPHIFKNWIYISHNWGGPKALYVSPDDAKLLKFALAGQLKPYVIKGSDWPYWFKLNNIFIESKTSSWFKFLYDNFGIMAPNWLEEYTGVDKEKEYLEKMNAALKDIRKNANS